MIWNMPTISGKIMSHSKHKIGLSLAVAFLIGGAFLLFNQKNLPPTHTNPSTAAAPLKRPLILGLTIGMSITEAQSVIDKRLKKFLFEGDEFMYSPFKPGSDGYKDAKLLRENIRFIKNSDGTYLYGGSFSFGYEKNNLRSAYTNVTRILPKNSPLHSEKQSFATGITLKADANQIVQSILFRSHLVKKGYNLNDSSLEDFTKKLVQEHQLDRLNRRMRGSFTGDLSLIYEQKHHPNFKITINDDLQILLSPAQ
jgi:hypothetical protein